MKKRDHLDGLEQELHDHIEAEIRDNLARGMSPDRARQAARIKLGNISSIREEAYSVWHRVWLEQLVQDIRFGLRTLRRNPGFTGTVVLTLALAIGMNAGVFSVIEAVILRPLPYPEANRLIWLASYSTDELSEHDNLVSRVDYSNWKDQARTMQSTAAYGNQDLAMMYHGRPTQERVASIAGDFWSLAGAQPSLGRLFREGEPHAMVLSHAFFERRFHSDQNALGQTVSINGFPFTIIGVLPRHFQFLFPKQYSSGDESRDIDAYIAFPPSVMRTPNNGSSAWELVVNRVGPTPYYVCVLGRLRAGVSLEAARAEMNAFYTRVLQQQSPYERAYTEHSAWRMKMLQDKVAGSARRALLVLLVAGGFVLFIACANISNLLLARAAVRQREMAVRAAMGAGRIRIIRQFVTESLLLASLGSVFGLLFAMAAIWLMARSWPQAVPRLIEARMDLPVALFTLVTACLTGIVFGLAPAITLWLGSVSSALKDGDYTVSGTARRINIRSLLVGAEVATAIVLLAGAGLMVKSFWRMNENPAGLNPAGILTMRVSLAGVQYNAWPAQQSYILELLTRLQSAPGVAAAGISGTVLHTNVEVDGLPDASPDQTFASIRGVSAGYLHAMGTPLLEGRWLNDRQMLDNVLVNETFARSLSRNGDVIGRHIRGSFLSGTIAGVVADFKYSQLDAEPLPEVYTSYELAPVANPLTIELFVRMADGTRPDAHGLEKIAGGIDGTQPVYDVETLEQSLSNSIAPRRFNLFLMGIIAGIALLMALVGIHGVVAHSVARRTREIGVRMALGATRSDVLLMILNHILGVAITGILIGICAALALTRFMQSLLYDVGPRDPLTLASVALVLTSVALLACLGPALRASRMNPVIALRHE
jgi:putative ABC transport system permease protein